MFDVLVAAYGSLTLATMSDPYLATTVARNLVRSIWEDKIWRHDLSVYDQIASGWDTQQFCQEVSAHERPKTSTKRNDIAIGTYHDSMTMRLSVRHHLAKLRTIMGKFGCRDVGFGYNECNKLPGSTREEINAWLFLERKLEGIEVQIGGHLKMHAQRAVMQESFEASQQTAASNRLARITGQLAKIATIFVPCQIVASIFSMNGEFAAGQKFFFVYWTITIPATLVLLFWVMYNEIQETLQSSGAQRHTGAVKKGLLQRLGLRTNRNLDSDEEKAD